MTTRRTVLLGGFGAGVFVAAASGWAWLSVGYSLPPDTVAVALSEKELAVVGALTEALVPGEDGMPNGLALRVPQRVDEEVRAAEARRVAREVRRQARAASATPTPRRWLRLLRPWRTQPLKPGSNAARSTARTRRTTVRKSGPLSGAGS